MKNTTKKQNGTLTIHDHEGFVRYRTWVKVKAKWKLLKRLRGFIDSEMNEIEKEWGDVMEKDLKTDKKKEKKDLKKEEKEVSEFMEGY